MHPTFKERKGINYLCYSHKVFTGISELSIPSGWPSNICLYYKITQTFWEDILFEESFLPPKAPFFHDQEMFSVAGPRNVNVTYISSSTAIILKLFSLKHVPWKKQNQQCGRSKTYHFNYFNKYWVLQIWPKITGWFIGDCSSYFRCNEETCHPVSVPEVNMLYLGLATQIIPLSSST